MAASEEVDPLESPRGRALRLEYRCGMCHKQCFIPCRLSTTVFRQLVEGTYEGPPPLDLPDQY